MIVTTPIKRVLDLRKNATISEVRCTCNKLLFKVADIHGDGVISTVCPRCKTPINVYVYGPAPKPGIDGPHNMG